MSYNIKELLQLPDEEKIAIADLLYDSLKDGFDESKAISSWYEDEKFVNQLEKEFESLKKGETKGYTLDEIKNFMSEQKAKYKSM